MGNSVPSPAVPLTALLRAGTRAEHATAEAAFDVERAFADTASYLDMLLRLYGWYAAVEGALAACPDFSRWVSEAGLQPGGWQRVGLLRADLAELGVLDPVRSADLRLDATGAAFSGLPRALGWCYVLAGSALGGRVLARLALDRLGAGLPVAFFESGRRDARAGWRSLCRALDSSGSAAWHERQVVWAARAAFVSFQRVVER